MSAVMTTTPNEPRQSPLAARYHLWVDGVGGFLLSLKDRMTLGGPADADKQSDVTLLANLSRQHATFVRSGEGYVLEPHGTTFVGNRQILEPTPLSGEYVVRLGSNVELRFRLPSVLSATGVLEFASDHRPVYSVDGVIMMKDTCLLGPGREHHVICDGWSETVVLHRRDGEFWCKSRNPVAVGGKALTAGGPIRPGDVVSSGTEVRFRLEEV
ncbi:MAG: FHA domain-containing protein [Planctomycetaceae bacterium]